MRNPEREQAVEAAALLTTMRAEVEALPEGPWVVDDGSIMATGGRYLIEAGATCNPECMGSVWTQALDGAESFVANSGDRSRMMIRALQSVLALHRETPCTDEDGEPSGVTCCEECKDLDDHSGERVYSVWPCFTVQEISRALAGEQTRMQLRAQIEADVEAVAGRNRTTNLEEDAS